VNAPLRLHVAAIGVAFAVTCLVHPAGVSPRLSLFGISVVAVECGVWGFLSWTRRANKALEEEFRREMAEMTIDEARRKAQAVLERSDRVTRSEPPPDQTLAPAVREFFNTYDRVSFTLGDVLELGHRDQGFSEVGTTSDRARLLIRDADGGLFEWEGAGTPPSGATPDFPTLFHWIATRA